MPRRLAFLLALLLAAAPLAAQTSRTITDTIDLGPDGRVVIDTYKGSIDVAAWSKGMARAMHCGVLKYDSVGVGKGVTSAYKRMAGVTVHPVNGGNSPTNTLWPDGARARDKFTNLRAELWWTVREALRKTYEHWLYVDSDGTGGAKHDFDDLLLLPDNSSLRAQLSLPKYFRTDRGKIQMERKSQMRARGVKSPDYADALVLTYAPAPAKAVSGRTTGTF